MLTDFLHSDDPRIASFDFAEKEAVKTVLSKDGFPSEEKVNKLPAVVPYSCSAEWILSWPGPL